MTTQLVSTLTGSSGGQSTITLPLDAAAYQQGDTFIVALRHQSPSMASDWAVPEGWSRVGPPFVASSASFRGNGFFAWTPPVGASIPATAMFKAPLPARCIGASMLVRGGDMSKLYASTSSSVVAGSVASPSGFVSPATPSLAIFYGAAEVSSGVPHIPTALPGGFTTAVLHTSSTGTAVGRTSLYVGTRQTSGVVDMSGEKIAWASTTSPTALGIGIPEAAAPTAPSGLDAHLGDKSTAEVYYTTGEGTATPESVHRVFRGYSSTAAMLTQAPFYWAHRGGSVSYPEHSLFAFTQSALHGFGALEMSLNRSSDGVWFGLHDASLTRVTGGASTADPSTLTWEQIQQYQTVTGATGAPRPFCRLEELVEAYGASHVLVLDAKYHAHEAGMNEVCDLIEGYYALHHPGVDWTEKVVWKGFYTAAPTATIARQRGCLSWGYLYERNLSSDANWSTKASAWDLLGLEYTDSQQAWDQVKALGKPVIGHICPDQAAVATALAKGASGVQCSGVAVIKANLPKQG